MKTNQPNRTAAPLTHNMGPAARINAETQLRRTVMASLLWEDTFYEDGKAVGERVAELVKVVAPATVSAMASEARNKMYLRHMPLLLTRELARHPLHTQTPGLVKNTLVDVIQRPDELAEFLALYWKDKRQPLSAQVKKGLATAFNKFGGHALAKYNRDGAVKLRDVAFLSHVKPLVAGGPVLSHTKKSGATVARHPESSLAKLIEGTLPAPDTWEVALSAGADKAETFRRLLAEGKLGGLAFLRNLRNMTEAGITKAELKDLVGKVKFDRVLPFRFFAAATAVPALEDLLEPLMLKAAADLPRLEGLTVLLVDVSGSMEVPLSSRSDLQRVDAACALAVLVREICDTGTILAFESQVHAVPPRRGFALRDAICKWSGGTNIGVAVQAANAVQGIKRLICITDEQSTDRVPAPNCKHAYMLNVGTYKNGVGYGQGWTHIDGWSENVIRYITELEAVDGDEAAV